MLRLFIKSRLSRGLRHAARNLLDEWQIQRIHRTSLRKARHLTARPLRLNLASGFHPKPGWINIDLTHPTADLRLDLRERLPFPTGSVSAIYCEHFLEHLEFASIGDSTAWQLEPPNDPSEALDFLRECWRVLQPNGICDLVVPDGESIILEYAHRCTRPFPAYEWWGPKWCVTPMQCVNYVFRQGREHKYAYDFETLERALSLVGFTQVRRREFDPSIDSQDHRIGSLYVTATKDD